MAARKEFPAQRDLQKELAAATVLKAQIVELLGDGEFDAVVLSDTVEGETGIFEAVDRVILQLLMDEERCDAISRVAASLAGRKARLEKRAESMRAMLSNVLDMLEQKKLERPVATITQKVVAPKLVIVNESEIPSRFYETPDPVLSRSLLTAELKARAAALDQLNTDRIAAGAETTNDTYRDKLAAIIAAYPPIPGAELGNGSVTVQVRPS